MKKARNKETMQLSTYEFLKRGIEERTQITISLMRMKELIGVYGELYYLQTKLKEIERNGDK